MQHLLEKPNTKNNANNVVTQNLTRKNAACGPLSYSSFNPPRLSGNLSAICRISTACIHTVSKHEGHLAQSKLGQTTHKMHPTNATDWHWLTAHGILKNNSSQVRLKNTIIVYR